MIFVKFLTQSLLETEKRLYHTLKVHSRIPNTKLAFVEIAMSDDVMEDYKSSFIQFWPKEFVIKFHTFI